MKQCILRSLPSCLTDYLFKVHLKTSIFIAVSNPLALNGLFFSINFYHSIYLPQEAVSTIMSAK